jgi:hypothetical protein
MALQRRLCEIALCQCNAEELFKRASVHLFGRRVSMSMKPTNAGIHGGRFHLGDLAFELDTGLTDTGLTYSAAQP